MRVTQSVAEARRQGFVVMRGDWDVANAWDRLCKEERRPFLRVRLFEKRALVSLDTLPAGHRFSEDAQRQIRAILTQAVRPEHRGRSAFVCVTADWAISGVVELHRVETVVRQLLEVVRGAVWLNAHTTDPPEIRAQAI